MAERKKIATVSPITKNKGGAPTKRTSENRDKLLQALRLGQSLERAAQYAGMSYELLRQWQAEDVGLLEAIKAARSEMEVAMLARIEQAAAKGQWQAAAWKLERILPQNYALRRDMDLGDTQVTVKMRKVIARPDDLHIVTDKTA